MLHFACCRSLWNVTCLPTTPAYCNSALPKDTLSRPVLSEVLFCPVPFSVDILQYFGHEWNITVKTPSILVKLDQQKKKFSSELFFHVYFSNGSQKGEGIFSLHFVFHSMKFTIYTAISVNLLNSNLLSYLAAFQ